MNILADTHILLWSIYDDDKLSDKAKNYLIDGRNRFYYSLVSTTAPSMRIAAISE